MLQKLTSASFFEIHCWSDEAALVEQILKFGSIKQSKWKSGYIVIGKITPEFVDFLLNLPKPSDTYAYNKMTPFFSIFLDNGFSSEHYGTELNQQ